MAGRWIEFGFLLLCFARSFADKPCAPREIKGESVVCVCNSTYCDDFNRIVPTSGSFVSYTSSDLVVVNPLPTRCTHLVLQNPESEPVQDGLRFHKQTGELTSSNDETKRTLSLDPATTYQTVEGFGGAVTDSAGINWKSLSEELQETLIETYFSKQGLEYNMIRVPIGGSDFSTHVYSYNDLPENDVQLSNFSLSQEDHLYKIPMIKSAMNVATSPIHVVATTWSPPLWMKTSERIQGFSRLKDEYLQTYADYHSKFLEKYDDEKIPIWGITTTNEPMNGVIPLARFNSLGWSADGLGKWIINNLGPTIRNSKFKDVKIIAVDDQRFTIPYWFDLMLKEQPEVLNFIDGVAVHYYGDSFTPASVLEAITNKHSDKFILATEACEGSFPWQLKKVVLGSWSRAKNYITDILEDLNYNVVGWIDWNLCLDSKGGPNWAKNFVDSPIIVFPENDEFVKQPMYYAMGHFSKFIPRGSVRIKVAEKKPFLSRSIDHVAFLTPRDTVVVVMYNSGKATSIGVEMGNKKAIVNLEADSVVTVEFPNEN